MHEQADTDTLAASYLITLGLVALIQRRWGKLRDAFIACVEDVHGKGVAVTEAPVRAFMNGCLQADDTPHADIGKFWLSLHPEVRNAVLADAIPCGTYGDADADRVLDTDLDVGDVDAFMRQEPGLKVYRMEVDAPSKEEAVDRVEEMCRRILTNPVIHTHEIVFL